MCKFIDLMLEMILNLVLLILQFSVVKELIKINQNL